MIISVCRMWGSSFCPFSHKVLHFLSEQDPGLFSRHQTQDLSTSKPVLLATWSTGQWSHSLLRMTFFSRTVSTWSYTSPSLFTYWGHLYIPTSSLVLWVSSNRFYAIIRLLCFLSPIFIYSIPPVYPLFTRDTKDLQDLKYAYCSNSLHFSLDYTMRFRSLYIPRSLFHFLLLLLLNCFYWVTRGIVPLSYNKKSYPSP